jgi:hypothetical protein
MSANEYIMIEMFDDGQEVDEERPNNIRRKEAYRKWL